MVTDQSLSCIPCFGLYSFELREHYLICEVKNILMKIKISDDHLPSPKNIFIKSIYIYIHTYIHTHTHIYPLSWSGNFILDCLIGYFQGHCVTSVCSFFFVLQICK